VQLFPTRPAVHVALAALGTVIAGMLLRAPAVVAWGGAMIVGLAGARAAAKVAIVRLRLAGLEMIWRTQGRVHRVPRGGEVKLEVELRNRDQKPVRYRAARAIASRELAVKLEPANTTIAPASVAKLLVVVRAPRAGKYCVHGLSLEVRGPLGLFEVPLAFANPLGVEVLPRPLFTLVRAARGGRSRLLAETGALAKRPGAGSSFYELRDHVSGDAFKHIAWKASARRGRLLVREFEREDRDVVWLVLDAAVGFLAGPLGRAPLDGGIDQMAALARRHLARGDQVGLAIAGIAPSLWLSPSRGARHAFRLAGALSYGVGALDVGRSDYDETDVARRVLEHLRFLDPGAAEAMSETSLDLLASRAEGQRGRAPFDEPAPLSSKPRDRALRRYLACFGISSPALVEPNRAIAPLADALSRGLVERPRPSLMYVWSLPPDAPSEPLTLALRKVLRRGVAIHWISTPHEEALSPGQGELSRAMAEAIRVRARVARERGERVLGKMGVRLVRPRPSKAP
jgi:uncharacterized protein (DUF58 family)